MTILENIWRKRTERQLVHAALHIEDFTKEGQKEIAAELKRRQLQSVYDIQHGFRVLVDRHDAWIAWFNERFPEMRSVTRPPLIVRLNGTGLAVVGRRNLDETTGSYVKTWAVTVLWIPIFMLRAYRVIHATDGSLRFMGVQPLSIVARVWNVVSIPVLIVALALIGWLS